MMIRGTKPKMLTIDWRARNMFDEIQREAQKLGINCVQETYSQTLEVCKANGTSIHGWNHLD